MLGGVSGGRGGGLLRGVRGVQAVEVGGADGGVRQTVEEGGGAAVGNSGRKTGKEEKADIFIIVSVGLFNITSSGFRNVGCFFFPPSLSLTFCTRFFPLPVRVTFSWQKRRVAICNFLHTRWGEEEEEEEDREICGRTLTTESPFFRLPPPPSFRI